MGTTTFSGPVKAGTIKDTTGTTVGTDVNNVGFVLMAQSAVKMITAQVIRPVTLHQVHPARRLARQARYLPVA